MSLSFFLFLFLFLFFFFLKKRWHLWWSWSCYGFDFWSSSSLGWVNFPLFSSISTNEIEISRYFRQQNSLCLCERSWCSSASSTRCHWHWISWHSSYSHFHWVNYTFSFFLLPKKNANFTLSNSSLQINKTFDMNQNKPQQIVVQCVLCAIRTSIIGRRIAPTKSANFANQGAFSAHLIDWTHLRCACYCCCRLCVKLAWFRTRSIWRTAAKKCRPSSTCRRQPQRHFALCWWDR